MWTTLLENAEIEDVDWDAEEVNHEDDIDKEDEHRRRYINLASRASPRHPFSLSQERPSKEVRSEDVETWNGKTYFGKALCDEYARAHALMTDIADTIIVTRNDWT